MKAGILGISLAGKSTLFQLLTGTPAAAPGGRPEARLGVARVPDLRVDRLAAIFQPKKRTLATVEYVDVPGVAKGEGGALVDLPALRGVDALVHVVRAFESDTAPHPDGSVDPLRDAKMLELELILADLGTVERRLERLEANIKKASKSEDLAERALFLRLKEALETERPLREMGLVEEETHRLRGYALLSGKPLLLVANLGEAEIREATAFLERSGLAAFARKPGVALCAVSAPIEAEMADLSPEDARPSATICRSPSRASSASSAPPTTCWGSSPSSPRARTSAAPGPSAAGRARRWRRAPSTRHRAASSAPRWSPSRSSRRRLDRRLPGARQPAARGPRLRGEGRRRHRVPAQRRGPAVASRPSCRRPVALARATCLNCGATLPNRSLAPGGVRFRHASRGHAEEVSPRSPREGDRRRVVVLDPPARPRNRWRGLSTCGPTRPDSSSSAAESTGTCSREPGGRGGGGAAPASGLAVFLVPEAEALASAR